VPGSGLADTVGHVAVGAVVPEPELEPLIIIERVCGVRERPGHRCGGCRAELAQDEVDPAALSGTITCHVTSGAVTRRTLTRAR
jgi:hypothetical protein